MVEQLSADYANYLMNTNIDREVSGMMTVCEEIERIQCLPFAGSTDLLEH